MLSATKTLLMSACIVGIALSVPQGHAAQTLGLSDARKAAQSYKKRPIRVNGQAHVTLQADMMSVNMSMSAVGNTMEEIIKNLQARRDELAVKAKSGDLNVVKTEISSLRIHKQGGNAANYRGDVQMNVQISGFEDPLVAVASIADESVSGVSNLRYGFSKELLEETDLCDLALTDARRKAAKQAEAAGYKLGRLVQYQCNDSRSRNRGFSSQASRQVSVNASASFAREE